MLAPRSAVHPGVAASFGSVLNLPRSKLRSFPRYDNATVPRRNPATPDSLSQALARLEDRIVSRTPIPFHSPDVSALARALVRQLDALEQPPGHLQMLNLLARAQGFRNFQALRASEAAQARLANPVALPAVDYRRVEQLRRYFDAEGRLSRWPKKFSHRQLCLWVVWSRLPARQVLDEAQLNARVQAGECLGDHLLLRRELVDGGWLWRTADGRRYRRLERRPPAEAEALLACLPTPR